MRGATSSCSSFQGRHQVAVRLRSNPRYCSPSVRRRRRSSMKTESHWPCHQTAAKGLSSRARSQSTSSTLFHHFMATSIGHQTRYTAKAIGLGSTGGGRVVTTSTHAANPSVSFLG
jgi:hypothetical protein